MALGIGERVVQPPFAYTILAATVFIWLSSVIQPQQRYCLFTVNLSSDSFKSPRCVIKPFIHRNIIKFFVFFQLLVL